ncbi:MAG TPA: hypothetical protein VFM08_00520 [Nocardioides sp.]|jgi:hypothetical protein|nr:hypothetical protein [Nocardioides sp.]
MSTRRLQPHHVEQLTLDTEPWLSCDDCFELVDQYVEGLVEGGSTLLPEMEAHLRGCPACAEEAATLAILVSEERDGDGRPVT